jgi:hypothetical protein
MGWGGDEKAEEEREGEEFFVGWRCEGRGGGRGIGE